jgi:uncharacterized membrane protein YgcG
VQFIHHRYHYFTNSIRILDAYLRKHTYYLSTITITTTPYDTRIKDSTWIKTFRIHTHKATIHYNTNSASEPHSTYILLQHRTSQPTHQTKPQIQTKSTGQTAKMGCHSSKLHSDYDYAPPMRQSRRKNRHAYGGHHGGYGGYGYTGGDSGGGGGC